MLSQPSVTVIIPFKNNIEYLFSAINSVFNQSYKNYKIKIIYDNEDRTDLNKIKKFLKYLRADISKSFLYSQASFDQILIDNVYSFFKCKTKKFNIIENKVNAKIFNNEKEKLFLVNTNFIILLVSQLEKKKKK